MQASGNVKGPMTTLAPSKCGSTQNMSANIKVVVRVRPLNDRELEQNGRLVVDVVDDKMLVFDPKEEIRIRPFFYQGVQQPNKKFLKHSNKELKFVFDNVCGPNATNKDVFETTTKDMLAALMEGYNCTVFVYGATGAGKTFTMIGNAEHPGITYLTMEHLFYAINSYANEREFDIGVSYIEVYNENVYDLLKPSNTPLQLQEDYKYGVMVAGLTLNNIKTARQLLNMLENGNKNRTQHPTDANAESSSSHAVFQVYVKMRYKTSRQLHLVKLSMIDLAGSERASATGRVGERLKEGANINKSLLSLGNCINRLADGSSYIPYRDSKLTRLLKDSLGGNCKTVMIANVSPANISYEATYNTLKYAARANKMQLSIKKNIVDGNVRASQYVKIIEELKKKTNELEARLSLSSVHVVQKESDMNKEKARDMIKISGVSNISETPNIVNKPNKPRITLADKENVSRNANLIRKPLAPPIVLNHKLLNKPTIPNESWKSSCDESFLQHEKRINDEEERAKAISEEPTLENIAEVTPLVSTPFEEHRNVQEYFNNFSEFESSALNNDNTMMCFDKPSVCQPDKREETVIVSSCDLLIKTKVTNTGNSNKELDTLIKNKKQVEDHIKVIENAMQALQDIKTSQIMSLQSLQKLIIERKKNKCRQCDTYTSKK